MEKTDFALFNLAKLAVKTLNVVDGVDQLAHLLGVLEIGAEIGPVTPPGLRNLWVFSFVPLLPQEVSRGSPQWYRPVQVGHKDFRFL